MIAWQYVLCNWDTDRWEGQMLIERFILTHKKLNAYKVPFTMASQFRQIWFQTRLAFHSLQLFTQTWMIQSSILFLWHFLYQTALHSGLDWVTNQYLFFITLGRFIFENISNALESSQVFTDWLDIMIGSELLRWPEFHLFLMGSNQIVLTSQEQWYPATQLHWPSDWGSTILLHFRKNVVGEVIICGKGACSQGCALFAQGVKRFS